MEPSKFSSRVILMENRPQTQGTFYHIQSNNSKYVLNHLDQNQRSSVPKFDVLELMDLSELAYKVVRLKCMTNSKLLPT